MRPFMRKLLPVFLMIGTIAAADFTGTWKLNPAKSQLGKSDIAQATFTIEQTAPDTYTSIVDQVTKSGEKRHFEVARICDGKEHPSTRPGTAKGEVLICQFGPGPTRTFVEKNNGKVVGETTSTLSEDGKVMTQILKYSDGEELRVFERQ
jgi:hypothetical protein